MIAGAAFFSSGILLFTDTEPIVPRRVPHESKRLCHRAFNSHLGSAHSVFVIGESVECAGAVFHSSNHAMDGVPPAKRTIERMRETVEGSLFENLRDQHDGEARERNLPLLVALYSPSQRRYALFHAIGPTLREVVGFDCQGPAASLGRYLMRDRYDAARSQNELDVTTVFLIAADTLAGIRKGHDGCGESSEMIAVYADGHVSAVQLITHDSPKQRSATLDRLTHNWRSQPGAGRVSHHPRSKPSITNV